MKLEDLERSLNQSISSHGVKDPKTFELVHRLRDHYKQLMFSSFHNLDDNNYEQSIWKKTNYKLIELYRAELKSTSGGTPLKQNNQFIYSGFRFWMLTRSFLTSSSGFYINLILEINQIYGLVPKFILEKLDIITNTTSTANIEVQPSKLLNVVYRSLIYLGDLGKIYLTSTL